MGPLREVSLRRGMYMADYVWGTFLFRPIAGGILLFAILSFIYNIYTVRIAA